MKTWRVKKGGDQRFRQGHPWIFSGELAHSARDVEPGEVVALHDASDRFLAYGMAHPTSNICFRKLSGKSKESDVMSVDFFLRRLEQARLLRAGCGWDAHSHRWVFGEVDGLPGLVVDSFRGEDDVTVFQIATAGMERARDDILSAFEKLGKYILIESSTSSQRKTEGLAAVDRDARQAPADLSSYPIELRNLGEKLSMRADLESGQKTGFFLDHQWNINLLLQLLQPRWSIGQSKLRVLDLCCYVGQWSTHVARLARRLDRDLEVDLADASEDALRMAKLNVESQGAAANCFRQDVMKEWDAALAEQKYDLVVCDPPGFTKKKADLAQGMSAYTRLNREAMRRLAPAGILVTSSCSGAVREADFSECLNAAKSKAGRSVKWLASGGHGPDHPVLLEFPEGQYLKCRFGQVDFPF